MSFQNVSTGSLRSSDAWKRTDAVVGELHKTLGEAFLLQDPPQASMT